MAWDALLDEMREFQLPLQKEGWRGGSMDHDTLVDSVKVNLR